MLVQCKKIEERKIKQKLAKKKYSESEHGKIAIKQKRKKYLATINGHLRHIFSSMLQRCNNPNSIGYKNYGGRGIEVRFTSDEFVDYVMSELKVDPRDLQIDRIDNDGSYEPGNIRFVTRSENLLNRSCIKRADQSNQGVY